MIYCVLFDARTGARIGYIRKPGRGSWAQYRVQHFDDERDDMIAPNIKAARSYPSVDHALQDARWIEGVTARAVHREPSGPCNGEPDYIHAIAVLQWRNT